MPRPKLFIFIMLLLVLSGGYYAFHQKMKSINKNEDQLAETRVEVKTSEVKADLTKSTSRSIQDSHIEKTTNGSKSRVKKELNQKNNVEQIVLGSVKEKINIEITLIDGLKNKALTDYPVETRYVDNKGIEQIEKHKSDSSGKLIIEKTTYGFFFLQIFTNDYATYAKNINMFLGENKIRAVLSKGGTLEIKAVDEKNEIVLGLMVKTGGFNSQSYRPLSFDSAKGVYVLSQIPFNRQEFHFKAYGYVAIDVSDFYANFEKPSQIKIVLKKDRRISFDLNVKNKPAFIQIVNDYTYYKWRCGIGEPHFLAHEIVKVPLNKEGKYEFYFDQFYEKIIVTIEKFVPMHIEIKADQDVYKLTPLEGFTGKIQVVDDTGKPVKGANVTSYAENYQNTSISDDNGFVILSCLSENIDLTFNIEHVDYGVFEDLCSFNDMAPRFFVIEICKKVKVSGKIYFDKKPVAGADVFLYVEKNGIFKRGGCKSEADGSYNFYAPVKNKYIENVEDRKDLLFFLKACHPKYGIVKSSTFKVENTSQVFDLSLISQKNFVVKLVDTKGNPIKGAELLLFESDHSDLLNDRCAFNCLPQILLIENESPVPEFTNENGECEFYALWSSTYEFKLKSEKFAIQVGKSYVEIPVESIVLTAIEKESKDYIRILKVFTPSGDPYLGLLSPLNYQTDAIFQDENGNYVLKIEKQSVDSVLIFTVPGFAPFRIGPYEDLEAFPKEQNITLVKGETVLVRVVDFNSQEEVPFVSVNIALDGKTIKSIQTDEKGEVEFSGLIGELYLKITTDNYAPYEITFDCFKTKEILVKLIKGGAIKVHLNKEEDVESFKILLLENEQFAEYGENGDFEFNNLLPGKYTLFINKTFKHRNSYEARPTISLIVENEKTIEINLDDLQLAKLVLTLPKAALENTLEKLKDSRLNISNRSGEVIFSESFEKSIGVPISIMPGEYKLIINDKLKWSKNIVVKAQQNNTEEIDIQEKNLKIRIRNEDGHIISDAFVSATVGEKYTQIESEWAMTGLIKAEEKSELTFSLHPNIKYCFFVRPNQNSNLQPKAFGPIELDISGKNALELILPFARKLPKIQIIDDADKPIEDADFIYLDMNRNFLLGCFFREPFSSKDGFLPEKGWPKESFKLIVSKEGYEFKEIIITENINPEIILQIKLKKAASIQCEIKKLLTVPIAIGLLNNSGVLIERPRFFFNTYFTNIAFGSVKFSELAAGTYYIGYFENGSTKLISKQGPFTIGIEENLVVTSTYK